MASAGACADGVLETARTPRTNNALRFMRDLPLTRTKSTFLYWPPLLSRILHRKTPLGSKSVVHSAWAGRGVGGEVRVPYSHHAFRTAASSWSCLLLTRMRSTRAFRRAGVPFR